MRAAVTEDLAAAPPEEESERGLEELVPGLQPTAHRPSQAGALAWALAQERGRRWTSRKKLLLPCRGARDVAVELDVGLSYEVRGGVLALGLGAGKTLVLLGLVAAPAADEPPQGLHAVPTTLIFAPWSNVAEGTWENEARRHAPGARLRVRTVTEERQLASLSALALRALDVLVLPHAALESWSCFQRQMDGAAGGGECAHAARCLRFRRTVAARAAEEMAREPQAELRWTLADLTPLGLAWRRLVVDDADQLLQRTSHFGNALLRYTQAARRWCLTATPRLDPAGLLNTCDFLRVGALAGTTEEWRGLVRAFFRGGSWDTSRLRVTHVTHRVRLSGLERACYESEYARAHASGKSDRLAVCVRRCAHWHEEGGAGALGLAEACDQSLHALEALRGVLHEELRALPHGAPYLHSVRAEKTRALARLEARGRYVAAVFAALTEQAVTSCPVCLETFGAAEERVAAPCGHIFHGACLEGGGERCAVCREPLHGGDEAARQLRPLRFRAQQGEQRTSSKIAAVVAFLRAHAARWRRQEGEGKALVLVQWTDLRARLEESLRAEGVAFVTHGGSVHEARERLALFSSAAADSPAVLLATFERRLGINIQHVTSHVLLVHPCVAAGEPGGPLLRPAEAEEQALARVVRPGQGAALPAGGGQVYFHRFVGADTVEETMVALPPPPWHLTETREA